MNLSIFLSECNLKKLISFLNSYFQLKGCEFNDINFDGCIWQFLNLEITATDNLDYDDEDDIKLSNFNIQIKINLIGDQFDLCQNNFYLQFATFLCKKIVYSFDDTAILVDNLAKHIPITAGRLG